MTEGTSQGLFIVVAIVIFGIFIVLANTVFGSEGLTSDLENLFTESIDRAALPSGNLITKNSISQHGGPSGTVNYTVDNKGKITLTSDGTAYVGVRIDSDVMRKNKEYKLSFNINHLEGIITRLGGHISLSDRTKVYIDGNLVSDTNLIDNGYKGHWHHGVPFNTEIGETHNVEILFNTNGWDDPNAAQVDKIPKFQSMYIQPNRHHFGEPFVVEITDLEMYEIKES